MTKIMISRAAALDAPVSTPCKVLTANSQAQPQSPAAHCRPGAKNAHGGLTILAAGICLLLGAGSTVYATTHSRIPTPYQKEAVMPNHASGTFEVKLTPQKPDNKEAESASLGRMSLDKQFHGDLEAISKGEMLSVMTDVKGSAGYVAIERVTGTLHGHSGTFVLQHSGTMTRGTPQLSVTVVPDSGTGQLAGLTGAMTIKITDGKHFYEFDYTLPDAH
jgi:Protein of unknown function (DUF3224)